MKKIGLASPDILYMYGTENAKKKGVIPRAEVRLKCVNALSKEALGDNFTVPFQIATHDVVNYLRTLARSAVAIINAAQNDEACSYTLCGVEEEDNLSFSAIMQNALQSAIASAARDVTLVFYYPERTDKDLITSEELGVMSAFIQIFYVAGIRISDVCFANTKIMTSARETHPKYFQDLYLDSYMDEIRKKVAELMEQEGLRQ